MDKMMAKWGGGEVLRRCVRGMLPKNRLRDERMARLKCELNVCVEQLRWEWNANLVIHDRLRGTHTSIQAEFASNTSVKDRAVTGSAENSEVTDSTDIDTGDRLNTTTIITSFISSKHGVQMIHRLVQSTKRTLHGVQSWVSSFFSLSKRLYAISKPTKRRQILPSNTKLRYQTKPKFQAHSFGVAPFLAMVHWIKPFGSL